MDSCVHEDLDRVINHRLCHRQAGDVLFVTLVRGLSLLPVPPASTTPFIFASLFFGSPKKAATPMPGAEMRSSFQPQSAACSRMTTALINVKFLAPYRLLVHLAVRLIG